MQRLRHDDSALDYLSTRSQKNKGEEIDFKEQNISLKWQRLTWQQGCWRGRQRGAHDPPALDLEVQGAKVPSLKCNDMLSKCSYDATEIN